MRGVLFGTLFFFVRPSLLRGLHACFGFTILHGNLDGTLHKAKRFNFMTDRVTCRVPNETFGSVLTGVVEHLQRTL